MRLLEKAGKKYEKQIKGIILGITQARYELAAMTIGGFSVTNAYAKSPNASNIIVSIIDQIITLFPAIGVVIALVGAFKLFMAFRNDQPDAYSNAVKDIVIGVLLITFKMFIWSGGANLKQYI